VLVRRRYSRAGVDQKEHKVGFPDGSLGLTAHASRKRLRRSVLESGSVDQPKLLVADLGVGLAPGWSCTSASRFPTSLLKSVDFPTFGRPAMTTV
jgi:hypothetical protein